jgi:chromosome segregation ATPase
MEEKILKAIEALTGKVDNMAKDIGVIKTGISEIKQKVNAINEQTADLTEFRTETRQKLERIENGIEVLGKEDFKNKVELVEIKKKIAK